MIKLPVFLFDADDKMHDAGIHALFYESKGIESHFESEPHNCMYDVVLFEM